MMATRSLLCLSVFVAGFVNVRSGFVVCTCEKEMTIDAAFSYFDPNTDAPDSIIIVHLISGDNVHVFRNYVPNTIVTTASLDLPQDDVIQAVYVPANQTNRRIVYGKDAIHFLRYFPSRDTRLTTIQYGKRRAFIEHGGPDAVGILNGNVYVFKGCQVVIRRRWDDWSDPMEIADVFPGVPCHVDAAWENQVERNMYLIKGKQLWVVNENFAIGGPFPMVNLFNFMDDWVLKPAKDEIVSN